MSEHLRSFLWLLLALSAALALVPQLLTRSAAGDRLFDPFGTPEDGASWIDRGVRLAFLGISLAAAALYSTSSS